MAVFRSNPIWGSVRISRIRPVNHIVNRWPIFECPSGTDVTKPSKIWKNDTERNRTRVCSNYCRLLRVGVPLMGSADGCIAPTTDSHGWRWACECVARCRDRPRLRHEGREARGEAHGIARRGDLLFLRSIVPREVRGGAVAVYGRDTRWGGAIAFVLRPRGGHVAECRAARRGLHVPDAPRGRADWAGELPQVRHGVGAESIRGDGRQSRTGRYVAPVLGEPLVHGAAVCVGDGPHGVGRSNCQHGCTGAGWRSSNSRWPRPSCSGAAGRSSCGCGSRS